MPSVEPNMGLDIRTQDHDWSWSQELDALLTKSPRHLNSILFVPLFAFCILSILNCCSSLNPSSFYRPCLNLLLLLWLLELLLIVPWVKYLIYIFSNKLYDYHLKIVIFTDFYNLQMRKLKLRDIV